VVRPHWKSFQNCAQLLERTVSARHTADTIHSPGRPVFSTNAERPRSGHSRRSSAGVAVKGPVTARKPNRQHSPNGPPTYHVLGNWTGAVCLTMACHRPLQALWLLSEPVSVCLGPPWCGASARRWGRPGPLPGGRALERPSAGTWPLQRHSGTASTSRRGTAFPRAARLPPAFQGRRPSQQPRSEPGRRTRGWFAASARAAEERRGTRRAILQSCSVRSIRPAPPRVLPGVEWAGELQRTSVPRSRTCGSAPGTRVPSPPGGAAGVDLSTRPLSVQG